MSDLPPIPNPSQQWGPPPPIASGRPARWPTLITLAIALTGVAIGFVGWFRPVAHHDQPPPKPTYSDQQAAEAKAKVCAAFEKVDRALDVPNAQGKPRAIRPRSSPPLPARGKSSRSAADTYSTKLDRTAGHPDRARETGSRVRRFVAGACRWLPRWTHRVRCGATNRRCTPVMRRH